MSWRDPKLWLGLIAATAVLTVVLANMGRTQPGPLAAVHAAEPSLSGMGSCANCHGGWFSDMTAACLECHEAVAAHLDSGRGLHGRLGEQAQQCGRCHSDHHGADFALVNRASFRLAGVEDPDWFDHGTVGFPMAGRHLGLDCTECHEHAETQPLPAGAHRYLGLDRDCASCHEDPHQGQMTVRCDQCHGQQSFDQPASFGHERFVPLLGGHGDLECAECHLPGTRRDLEFVGRHGAEQPRLCRDCHESPHAPSFVQRAARITGRPEGQSCGACHEPDHLRFDQPHPDLSPFLHAASGFALAAPHDQAQCTQCHPQSGTFAERHPGRSPDSCASCHQDPHGGQFEGSPLAQDGCVSCHQRGHFEPHAFSLEQHAQTRLPLTGRHRDLECRECHQRPADELPRRFRGTRHRCDDCHQDAHQGRFDHLVATRRPAAGSCALCHGTATFADVPDFDHLAATGFPLDGAHAVAQCTACHPRLAEPDRFGRTLGRAAGGDHQGCHSCHGDPHQGSFDRVELPAASGGPQGCARCHTTVSFRSILHSFDHGTWTGFPLHGAHRQAQCASCHPPLIPPDDSGRTWQRALGRDCHDCHDDVHRGQFEVDGRTDCRRCHRPAETFHELTFRHDVQARFQLGRAHGDLPCSTCHLPERIGDELVVRYRPIPRECVDCHGTQPSDPLRQIRGGGR